ncbi:Lrp/AsnC family transcriptional regulator [Limnobacter alexandrii]|uniref:Lrp/AsnC family transcriptional regulator n=1 Tax=Limnobacter alexandrii TaxID=2570352 RepID=UPI0011099079|nr:Lrp/AsnC family transcriptional regulator [Limnobacter alexandrii]
MDTLDRQLLGLLRTNARLSIAALAHQLKVSRGTVSNRISKLESQGVIVGYSVKLRPNATANLIVAWMSILIEGNDSRTVLSKLLGEPGVKAIHSTNGRWDLLVELQAENLNDLSGILERIRLIKGISNTETSIHLSSYKN